jgi:hypothetical protein
MRNWGIFCLILGVGAFVLPMMDMQFRLLNVLGEENTPLLAGLLIVVGVVLVGLSMRKAKETAG